MPAMFEEIAHQQTAIGELALRRRRLSADGDDIWEIKLNDGYLMSSQFVEGEVALAQLALGMTDADGLDVVVGGLGLGYTAEAVLRDQRVKSLTVVELIPEVIDWHRRHLLPLGKVVAGDPRCTLLEADFFTRASGQGFNPQDPDRSYDAILIDIDHSTTHLIDEGSASFYRSEAIAAVVVKLKPGGVFALWSTDAEEPGFVVALEQCLSDVRVEKIEFVTPYRDDRAFNVVYLGRRPR